jgi:antirestriction protein ArdC
MATKDGQDTVYRLMSEQLIAALTEAIETNSCPPWRKPFAEGGVPTSFQSGKAYRGINFFILWFRGYTNPYWLTFKQLTELGGSNKGEKGTRIIHWNIPEPKRDETGEVTQYRPPFATYTYVWNYQQVDWQGNPPDLPGKQLSDFTPDEQAQQVIDNMPGKPLFTHEYGAAWYSPTRDTINVPDPAYFVSKDAYYTTLFHEVAHSTGHPARLHRFEATEGNAIFTKDSYSIEELTAEMAGSMLAGLLGLNPEAEQQNTIAYLRNWIKPLQDDIRMAVKAAAAAQKAVDHIMGVKWDTKAPATEETTPAL